MFRVAKQLTMRNKPGLLPMAESPNDVDEPVFLHINPTHQHDCARGNLTRDISLAQFAR